MMNHCRLRESPTCSGDTHSYEGVNLVYAGGHCHAPSCISMELFNADTGELICRQLPIYGKSNQVSAANYFIIAIYFFKYYVSFYCSMLQKFSKLFFRYLTKLGTCHYLHACGAHLRTDWFLQCIYLMIPIYLQLRKIIIHINTMEKWHPGR